MAEEGHYAEMRRKALRLMVEPIEKGGLGWPREIAEARLDAWDAEAASRGEDRQRLDYWRDGLRWIREQFVPRNRGSGDGADVD